MNKYLLIRESDGFVTNVIVWDGEGDYTPEEGIIIMPWDSVICPWIGWTYNSDGSWSSPLDEED
jgi:hypothetical protein